MIETQVVSRCRQVLVCEYRDAEVDEGAWAGVVDYYATIMRHVCLRVRLAAG